MTELFVANRLQCVAFGQKILSSVIVH